MPAVPYVIGGKIFQVGGTTPSTGNTVQFIHEDSGEILTVITAADGSYAFDLTNLTSYDEGDYFQIIPTGSTSTSQDMRLRIIARNIMEIPEIKIKYKTN